MKRDLSKYILLTLSFSPLFSSTVLAAGTLLGPSKVCPGTTAEYRYRAKSCYDGPVYYWECSNCEVWDYTNQQWSNTAYYANGLGGAVDVRFLNSTGSTATIEVTGTFDLLCTTYWTKTVQLGGGSQSAFIIGDDELLNCGNYSNTYSVYNLGSGWQVGSWSASSGLTIVSTSGTTATVKPSSSSQTGSKTLTAYIYWVDPEGQTCTTTSLTKTITITNPYMYVSGSPQICPGGIFTFEAKFDGAESPIPGATYSWSYPSGLIPQGGTTGAYITLYNPTNVTTGGALNASATVSCGTYNNSLTIYTYCAGGYAYSASPNPTQDVMKINIEKLGTEETGSAEESTEEVFLISLRDDAGVVYVERESKERTFEVSLQALNKGTYFLKVFVNDTQIGDAKRIIKN